MDATEDDLIRPDYGGGGLLNLMATLGTAAGAASPYPLLDRRYGLAAEDLAAARQIVLIVIDGMGDALLSPDLTPTLWAHRRGRLTSVYPSTTASAITSCLTALPPARHGLTGWHIWFAEIDRILAVLPLVPRGPRVEGWSRRPLPAKLFDHAPLSARLTRRHVTLSPASIVESPFNVHHTPRSERVGYAGPGEFFPRLAGLVQASRQPAYLYAYLPDLDELLHEVGPGHAAIGQALRWLDAAFAGFLTAIAGSDAQVVVTADHGFIAAPAERTIDLADHPALAAMLTRPLCGERRVAYAYVRRECRRDFTDYVAAHLGHACRLYHSEDFIAAGWFGPPPLHPRLQARAGDYVLLMRADWTLLDWLPGERRYDQRGVHAGASAAEMWVPLIAAAV